MREEACIKCGADEQDHYDGVLCPVGNGDFSATDIFTSRIACMAITCPDCHAPVNVQCVTTHWRAADGQFMPYHVNREPHHRRMKRFSRFGAEPVHTRDAKTPRRRDTL